MFWSADWTLFFDFASDSFWRRSVRGQWRRRSQSRERSRLVKNKQREGDLDCWLRLLSRDPGAPRDVRRYSIDAPRFLLAAANRASISLLATCCFNFETNIIRSSFRSRPANQLFLVHGDASGSIILSVNFPADKKPFAEDVFCMWTTRRWHCSRRGGLRLEITSFRTTRFAF